MRFFIGVALTVLIIIWLIILSILYYKALRHYNKLTKEVAGVDLKGLLEEHLLRLGLIKQRVVDLEKEAKEMRKLSLKYIQKVGIIRYNPYGDTGGDQSFAIALLTAQGDGIVISSLHGRGGTRIYAKPVKGGKDTKYPFSDEEKRAIKGAQGLQNDAKS